MTIFLFIVLIMYATRKFQIWLFREDPFVATYTDEGAFSSDDMLDLRDANFMIAFAVFDYVSGKPYIDDTMVQWKVKMDEFVGQARVNTEFLSTHPCSDNDMNNFFTFSNAD